MQTLEEIKQRLAAVDNQIAEFERERRNLRKQAKRILTETANQFGIEVSLTEAPRRRRGKGISPLGKTSPEVWMQRASNCLERQQGLTFGQMKSEARLNAQQLSVALKTMESQGAVRKEGRLYYLNSPSA